jgi:hypothetical protein
MGQFGTIISSYFKHLLQTKRGGKEKGKEQYKRNV